jgi:hypothetical protein
VDAVAKVQTNSDNDKEKAKKDDDDTDDTDDTDLFLSSITKSGPIIIYI